MSKKPNPAEGLHLGDRVKFNAEGFAGNTDATLRGKIGDVVAVRDDGRVSVRFEGGRLLIGCSPESFARVVQLGPAKGSK